MILYFAGISPIDYSIVYACGVKNILRSFFDLKNNIEYVKKMKSKFNLFIDSGAFTAFTSNIEINIDDYIKFIKEINIDIYASLDVIRNAQKSYKNFIYMRSKNLNPIPTFHFGSKIEWLYELLYDYKYIALGGMATPDISNKDIRLWLDRIFKIIYEKNNKLKVHGFGCSSEFLMECYPWHSVDSTSWLGCIKFGNMPDGRQFADIIKKYNIQDAPKLIQRQILLMESIRYFLSLEDRINKKHKDSNFERLNQEYLF